MRSTRAPHGSYRIRVGRVRLGVGVRGAQRAGDVGGQGGQAALGGGVPRRPEMTVQPGPQEAVAVVRIARRGDGLHETGHGGTLVDAEL